MTNSQSNTQAHKKQVKRDEQERGEEKAKVFENCFGSGGEENERRMENNVMRGRKVYGGYLVCWFSLEEERVMQQSSISISLSFENQGINPVGDDAQATDNPQV